MKRSPRLLLSNRHRRVELYNHADPIAIIEIEGICSTTGLHKLLINPVWTT